MFAEGPRPMGGGGNVPASSCSCLPQRYEKKAAGANSSSSNWGFSFENKTKNRDGHYRLVWVFSTHFFEFPMLKMK